MNKEEKFTLIKIIITVLLFIISFIIDIRIEYKIVLYVVIYLIIGGEIVLNAIKILFKGELFDENFLMSLATIGAFTIGEYSEAIAVMLFYQIGELFQDLAVEKSKNNISKLMDIRPDYANIEENGEYVKVNSENISIGTVIVVKPGEKIPLDGIIIKGSSTLNTTALTGESNPKSVKISDNVFSGCINLSGLLYIKTTSSFQESTVSKILELVENTEDSKSNTEKFITKFARVYTPIVVVLAIIIVVIPTIIFGDFSEWLNRALIFLVISCPCALVVSVPLSFFAGIGCASKNGILIKGANFLESLVNSKTIVFDKTGTLTKGNFKVVAIHPEKITKDELLEIACLAEKYSTHPISLSLKESYKKILNASRVKDVKEISGQGIEALVDNKKVFIGNDKLMNSINISYEDCEKDGTISHIVVDNEYMGHIVISDEVKTTSKKTIKSLKKCGFNNIVMLTGDKKKVGDALGKELNLYLIKSELSPVDKVNEVKKLKKLNSNVIFVGDGINDAPVLKISDVGIAMGALGSDAAIEAADIVLMNDDPFSIVKAIFIAKKTLKIVKQNIVFALLVKLVILSLGALGLANMWEAVFADVGVSFIAILNSLRCFKN